MQPEKYIPMTRYGDKARTAENKIKPTGHHRTPPRCPVFFIFVPVLSFVGIFKQNN